MQADSSLISCLCQAADEVETLMKNSYIKFKALEKGRRNTPESISARIEDVTLTTIVPVANPDFENKFDEVSTWLIEFEGDSYYPNREIGLDTADVPVMILPWKKNYGYWTDNDLTIESFRSHFKSIDIPKEEFVRYWKLFEANNSRF